MPLHCDLIRCWNLRSVAVSDMELFYHSEVYELEKEELGSKRGIFIIMREAKFSIDTLGDKVFEGFTNGEEWNGWACPYFTFEQAQRVVKAQTEMGLKAWYNTNADAFSFEVDASDEIDSFPAQEIEGKKLYPVGTSCWIWEQYDSQAWEEVVGYNI